MLYMPKKKYKQLILVFNHSSWWKKKKYRKESSYILKKYRIQGWRLSKKIDIKKESNTIDSRVFRKYYLAK